MKKNLNLSRRDMLKSLGVGALGLGLVGTNFQRAMAQISPPETEIAASYKFKVGDFDAMVIKDRSAQLNTSIFAGNIGEGVADEFFNSVYLATDGTIPNIVQILVVNTGDNIVVFDTGFGPGTGALVPTLAQEGIAPEDVGTVVISHFHPDHITGLSMDGVLTFPNATVYFPQPEYDFMESAPADSPASGLIQGAKDKLAPAMDAGQVVFYNDADEIVSGIQAVAAHGHTPGHMAFMIESNGNRLMNIVDTTVNAYLGLQHPDWYVQFDAMPDMAVETRKAILGRASDERIPIFGYHFPFPGLGYPVRQGSDDVFTWTPVSY